MSIFANENSPNVGMRIAPNVAEGTDGFAAFGKAVPFYRKSACNDHLKAMGVENSEDRFRCIERMAEMIQRDNPHGAMQVAYEYVDVTGTYVLLAVLCAAEEPSR